MITRFTVEHHRDQIAGGQRKRVDRLEPEVAERHRRDDIVVGVAHGPGSYFVLVAGPVREMSASATAGSARRPGLVCSSITTGAVPAGSATSTLDVTARPLRCVRRTSRFGGAPSPARGFHRRAGECGASAHDVVHGIGHEEIAVGVDRFGDDADGGELRGRQHQRRRIRGVPPQDGEPVADPAPRMLGANRELSTQGLDPGPLADGALDGAPDRFAQVRTDAHLVGECVREADAVGLEVDLPTGRFGVVERTVAQDRGG